METQSDIGAKQGQMQQLDQSHYCLFWYILVRNLSSRGSCPVALLEGRTSSGKPRDRHAGGAWTRITFRTLFQENRVRERVKNAGAADFLRQPFDEVRLFESRTEP